MAAGEQAVSQSTDWKKKESLKSATLQIILVGLVLAGVVLFLYKRSSNKKEIGVRLTEATSHFMKGNPKDLEKALAEVEQALAINSSSPEALSLAAGLTTEQWLVHRLPGAEPKAKDFLARAEDANAKSAERYGSRATIWVAEGKAQEAESLMEELRKKGANKARLWQATGQSNQAIGNLTLAKQAYNASVEREWKDARFPVSFAQSLMAEGNFLQAHEVITKALSIHPDHFQLKLLLAWENTLRQDRVKDAEDTVREVLSREAEISPGIKALTFAVSAEISNFKNEYDQALKAANEALQLDGTYSWALFAKARALGLKKDASTLEAFKAAIAHGKTMPLFYFEGAKLLQAAGQHEAAISLLDTYESVFKNVQVATTDEKVASFLERDDRYWLTRGDILKEAQKYDAALVSYDKAIAAANVNLPKAHLAKGLLFLTQKQYDKAQQMLENLAPEDGSGHLPEAYFAMGDLLFAQKNFGAGCQNFAFGLSKFKAQRAPLAKLESLLTDVQKKLLASNQPAVAKAWMTEAKPLIQ